MNNHFFSSSILKNRAYDNVCLKLNYNENFKTAFIDIQNVKTIRDRGHSRAIRRKTGFKNIITGDIFYDKLCWTNTFTREKTGMAIVRNNQIIWYCMPGENPNSNTREVIFEKTKLDYDILQFLRLK